MKIIFAVLTLLIVIIGGVYLKNQRDEARLQKCIITMTELNKAKQEALLAEINSSKRIPEKINPAIIQKVLHEGLKSYGESSETYMINSSFTSLANSRRKGYLARGDRFQQTSSELALKGNAGNLEEIDSKGNPVLSVFSPLDYKGKKWAIITQIDIKEAISKLYK